MYLSAYKSITETGFVGSHGYITVASIHRREVNLVDVYMDDEKNFYRFVAFDVLQRAWKGYNLSVDSVVVVLRENGFSEEESSQLIEASRK